MVPDGSLRGGPPFADSGRATRAPLPFPLQFLDLADPQVAEAHRAAVVRDQHRPRRGMRRVFPRPRTSFGEAHSTCSWQSPNVCLVEMADLEIASPLSMVHLSPPFHADRSLPSKSTTASPGGGMQTAAASTRGGSAQTMPLS